MSDLTFPPGNDLIFHSSASLSGAYCAVPMEVRAAGSMASGGSGNSISTLVAVERSLNWLRAFTMYSTRLREWRSIMHSTQIRGFTWDDITWG